MGLFNKDKKTSGDASDSDASDQEDQAQEAAEPKQKMGLFAKFRFKTKQLLKTDIRDLFGKEGRLVDDAFLRDLKEILIKTDMGVAAAEETIEEVQSNFRARKVMIQDVLETIKQKL